MVTFKKIHLISLYFGVALLNFSRKFFIFLAAKLTFSVLEACFRHICFEKFLDFINERSEVNFFVPFIKNSGSLLGVIFRFVLATTLKIEPEEFIIFDVCGLELQTAFFMASSISKIF